MVNARKRRIGASALITVLAFCAGAACDRLPGADILSSTLSSTPATPEETDPNALLAAAVAADHRTPAERARDPWRHPQETLTFFGIAPQMTVMEIWPGGGWYTNILAPYLASTDGALYAAHFDPDRSPRAAAAVADFAATFTTRPELYGTVKLTVFAPPAPAGDAESMDAVLTFRNAHNWLDNGQGAAAFGAFFRVLKPGGVLGVVDHRADDDAKDGESHGGYVTEASIRTLAEDAGFAFEAASEINANPADTKDHPFGVWTLPPVRRSAEAPGMQAADFPRAAFDAIGESDRMTLRFRKPAQSPGATPVTAQPSEQE